MWLCPGVSVLGFRAKCCPSLQSPPQRDAAQLLDGRGAGGSAGKCRGIRLKPVFAFFSAEYRTPCMWQMFLKYKAKLGWWNFTPPLGNSCPCHEHRSPTSPQSRRLCSSPVAMVFWLFLITMLCFLFTMWYHGKYFKLSYLWLPKKPPNLVEKAVCPTHVLGANIHRGCPISFGLLFLCWSSSQQPFWFKLWNHWIQLDAPLEVEGIFLKSAESFEME